jgi:hypothetical protein
VQLRGGRGGHEVNSLWAFGRGLLSSVCLPTNVLLWELWAALSLFSRKVGGRDRGRGRGHGQGPIQKYACCLLSVLRLYDTDSAET